MQMQALPEERASAARAAEETLSVRKLLAGLRAQAEQAGPDLALRAEILRTATKGIAVYRTTGTRALVTYAFSPAAATVAEPSRSGDGKSFSFTAYSRPARRGAMSRTSSSRGTAT